MKRGGSEKDGEELRGRVGTRIGEMGDEERRKRR